MADVLQAIVSESVGNVGNRSLSFGSNVTAGSTLVAVAQGWRSGGFDPSISDNNGNGTWNVPVNTAFGGASAHHKIVAYVYNANAGATQVTLSCSAASYFTWSIFEIPGNGGTNPIDAIVDKNEAAFPTPNTGSTGTLAQADELAVAVIGEATGIDVSSISVDSGFTQVIEELDIDTHQAGEIDYKPLSATTALDVTWTLGEGHTTGMALVTFKTSSTPPTNPSILFLRR